MAKRPIRPSGPPKEGGATPPEARTDGNVTRIPAAPGGKVAPANAVPPTPAAAPSDDDLTADALRHELDRGRGGDKVDFTDPAAAPLGTDDEAGGHPPTREQILQAAREESGPARRPEPGRTRRTIGLRQWDGLWPGLVIAAAVLLGLLVVVAVY